MTDPRPSAPTMIVRALLRRCPNCGGRGIFAGYTTLRERCPQCGLRLQRGESDYFIGAYLLNLVAVDLLLAGVLGAIVIATYPRTPWVLIQWGGLGLMLAGAVLCYPFAKALWLAADLIFRPVSAQEMEWHRRDGTMDDGGSLPHL
jgi:uncharacterized protein (DUF983 family)